MTPRKAAVRCLIDVEAGAYSNLAFKQRMAGAGLDARDVQFCARLFYGALERTITLDYILSAPLGRDISKLDAEVRAILRSGLYQCLYMDAVPVPTAVDESVKLCAAFKKRSASGLVNAVLRRAATFDLASLGAITDETGRLSARYAVHPRLAQLLRDQYSDAAEGMLAATLERAPTALRVNTLRATPQSLLQMLANEGIETTPAPVEGGLLVQAGRYIESPLLADGTMRVQSVAAQFAVQQLMPQPGRRVLDLCAAPGGKALTAAQIMQDNGHVTAVDIHPNRLALIDKQAKLEGITIVESVCGDAISYGDAQDAYDAVLCDVPCSGYGEMAQKPELRQKPPQTDGRLSLLQGQILANGARLVRPGGRLVYATCTLDKRENEQIVDDFLTQNDSFVSVAAKNLPPAASSVGQYVKFVPQKGYNEGFFIATLERI